MRDQAIAIVQPLGNADLADAFITGPAVTYETLGDYRRARDDYEATIRYVETVHVSLVEEDQRLKILNRKDALASGSIATQNIESRKSYTALTDQVNEIQFRLRAL